MKSSYHIAVFLTIFLSSGSTQAQVKLPIDANNCAIFNALNSDNTLYCTQTPDLGAPRGLIVTLGGIVNTPDTPDSVAQISSAPTRPITIARKKNSAIDHKAAKSETGYYIHFAFDSENLEKSYRDHLDRLAIVLNSDALKQNCVRITGHTDTIGTSDYNFKLSKRRAQSVYTYLSKNNNLDIARFTIDAKGETLPLPNKSGKSPYNRRVEFSSKATTTGCKSSS